MTALGVEVSFCAERQSFLFRVPTDMAEKWRGMVQAALEAGRLAPAAAAKLAGALSWACTGVFGRGVVTMVQGHPPCNRVCA